MEIKITLHRDTMSPSQKAAWDRGSSDGRHGRPRHPMEGYIYHTAYQHARAIRERFLGR